MGVEGGEDCVKIEPRLLPHREASMFTGSLDRPYIGGLDSWIFCQTSNGKIVDFLSRSLFMVMWTYLDGAFKMSIVASGERAQ